MQTVLPAMFPLKTSAKYVFVYREQPAITSQNFVSEENNNVKKSLVTMSSAYEIDYSL